MIHIIAKKWAKFSYIFRQLQEAATNDLHAGLAIKLAGEKRALIEKLNKEADEIEVNIKSMDEKLDKGFWECENGHENSECKQTTAFAGIEIIPPACLDCDKPVKFISQATMTGQEKYESDKERKEAEKIAADKRAQAAAEEEKVAEGERTAKYFGGLAANARTIAERIRNL